MQILCCRCLPDSQCHRIVATFKVTLKEPMTFWLKIELPLQVMRGLVLRLQPGQGRRERHLWREAAIKKNV